VSTGEDRRIAVGCTEGAYEQRAVCCAAIPGAVFLHEFIIWLGRTGKNFWAHKCQVPGGPASEILEGYAPVIEWFRENMLPGPVRRSRQRA
jgi:hypothetical protein